MIPWSVGDPYACEHSAAIFFLLLFFVLRASLVPKHALHPPSSCRTDDIAQQAENRKEIEIWIQVWIHQENWCFASSSVLACVWTDMVQLSGYHSVFIWLQPALLCTLLLIAQTSAWAMRRRFAHPQRHFDFNRRGFYFFGFFEDFCWYIVNTATKSF